MVIVLYMMEVSPPCRAVLMTFKYLHIPVKVIEENVVIGSSRQHKEFAKINPRSCVPTINDEGFCLCESRAIMTYLANKYAPSNSVYPKDPKKRAMVDMMLNFDLGTLYKSSVEYLYPLIFRAESPNIEKESAYKKSLGVLEQSLQEKPYIAGKKMTLADISIVASISLAEVYEYNLLPFPNVTEWLQRMKKELPFYWDVNEIPLLQFKIWYNPGLRILDDEESLKEIIITSTKM